MKFNKKKKENIIKQPISEGVAKVPVVIQMEALECGAACLTMVLAYYNKWVPLEQVRVDCGVSRDGSKASNMVRAARTYGLDSQGYKFELDEIKTQCKFPCIVHWNFNHFVVLNGFKKDKVYINDPARGNCVITMDEFDKSFTGICLMFEPNESFIPSGQPKSMLEFAKSRMVGTRVAIAFAVSTTIIASLIGIINPSLSRVFIDRLLTGQNKEWFSAFIFLLSIITIVQIMMNFIEDITSSKINAKIAAVGSTTFMWKVLHLPIEFFSQRLAGDIQLRKSSNAKIASTLVETFAPLIIETGMMVFYLVVMIRYSLILTAVGILSILINVWVSNWISKKRVNATRVAMRDAGKLNSCTVAGIEMIETIKASGAEDGYFERWSGYQANLNAMQVKSVKTNNYIGVIPQIISSVSSIVVMVLGVFLTIQGQFTIGMVTAFQGFLSSFLSPAEKLVTAGQTLLEMRTDMERVEDVLKYPNDIAFNGTNVDENTEKDKLSGAVEVKDVVFGYSKLEDPIVKGVSFSLKQGESIAIVGASGCGKSTLSKIISGLYQPWEGSITFDGKAVTEIDRGVFTSSVAVVDQDIILFEDTIANNIKMWDDSIEDFEVIMAARDAQLHEDIMQRNGGYNYKITEGGKDFSGGQRQRMEIARVLAQNPTIVILDEATSALDAQTEYNVVKSIKERGITCIVIAHRLSTIRDCDEIVVLNNGEVVERGKHKDLYALNGYYTELVTNE